MSGVISAVGITTAGLSEAGAIAGIIGAGIGAVGAYKSGQAAKASGEYNSEVAANNATIAQQNATLAAQEGNAAVEQSQLKTRAQVGGILANQAAAGVDVNKGSAVDVRSSAAELGELSALNIRSSAARQAYGYNVQATNDTAQSQLDKSQGDNAATAGDIGAGATIISGVGSAASGYANFLKNNSLNTNDITAAAPSGSGSGLLTT